MKKGILVVGWLLCSYINWGLTLGFFDREFPTYGNVGISAFVAIMGPPGTVAIGVFSLINGGFHWRVKPPTTEERWQAFHKRWPMLTREDFDHD